jgi:hypothetical protein
MVRVIAEISVHSPTASSNERHKYQHGYQKNEYVANNMKEQQTVYKRPVLNGGGGCCGGGDSSGMDKKPMSDAVGDYIIGCISNILEKNEREQREQQQEQREQHEQQEQQEQQEQREQQEQQERKKKEINTKLGKIIYKTRAGGVFEAYHSVHMTVNYNYDRKTGHMVQTYTEKIIWNDRVFESKQEWFSVMNRLSVAEADANMKIVRWD